MMSWTSEKWKGDKPLCSNACQENLNIPALKGYITYFLICLYKRDIMSKMVSDIMGHPVPYENCVVFKLL